MWPPLFLPHSCAPSPQSFSLFHHLLKRGLLNFLNHLPRMFFPQISFPPPHISPSLRWKVIIREAFHGQPSQAMSALCTTYLPLSWFIVLCNKYHHLAMHLLVHLSLLKCKLNWGKSLYIWCTTETLVFRKYFYIKEWKQSSDLLWYILDNNIPVIKVFQWYLIVLL